MNRKSGITLSSLVIYTILFFTFTFFVTTITANVNKTMFVNRGKAYNLKNISKTNSYFVGSSKNSTDVYMIGNNLVFENQDEYTYDQAKKAVYKNGKVILKGISKFIVSVENVSPVVKQVTVDIEYEKYMVKKKESFKYAVREVI